MKAQIKVIALGMLFVVIQSLIMHLTDRRLYPDLVLILALALGLRGDRTFPLVLAFGFGFAIDVLSSSPPGLYALLRGTACAATRIADRALYLRAPAPWATYVLGYVLFDSLLLGLVTTTLEPDLGLTWGNLLWHTPLVSIFTALVAGPLYPLLDRLDSGSSYDGGWNSLRLRGRI